jgi:hypothetical protein
MKKLKPTDVVQVTKRKLSPNGSRSASSRSMAVTWKKNLDDLRRSLADSPHNGHSTPSRSTSRRDQAYDFDADLDLSLTLRTLKRLRLLKAMEKSAAPHEAAK